MLNLFLSAGEKTGLLISASFRPGAVPMNKQGYVYIVGNNKPVLYIGVTSNLIKRVFLHKTGLIKGFSKRYGLWKLLYYEVYDDIETAICREKQLKNWHREWKLNLIRKRNPTFKDLYPELIGS